MKLAVIGCGNADRGDDGAGVLVARRLRDMGVDAVEQSGEALALIASWEGADRLILIDAVSTGAPAGTVSTWDARGAPLVRNPRRSTHGFGVGEAVQLARALDRLPPSVTIYGIEAGTFEAGSAPSDAVLNAVRTVADAIAKEVLACTTPG